MKETVYCFIFYSFKNHQKVVESESEIGGKEGSGGRLFAVAVRKKRRSEEENEEGGGRRVE